MTTCDNFFKREVAPLLDSDETIVNTGTVFTGPSLLSSLFGVSPKQLSHYYVVLTTKRLVLIKTGLDSKGLKTENHGVTCIPMSELSRIETGGFLNRKTLTIHCKDRTSTTFHYNTMANLVEGHSAFCLEVPKRLQEMIQAN
jgi:hypothetical protein